MAITIYLKNNKENKVKLGILGFSWTTFLFGLFVPLFRRDFKIFIFFALVYMAVLYFMPYSYSNIDGIISFQMTDDLGVYNIFSSIFYFMVNILGAIFYNKIYTQALVKKGYYPVSSEEVAILQAYNIIVPAQEVDQE